MSRRVYQYVITYISNTCYITALVILCHMPWDFSVLSSGVLGKINYGLIPRPCEGGLPLLHSTQLVQYSQETGCRLNWEYWWHISLCHNFQTDCSVFYTITLDMLRALTCLSSGGKIVFAQHLVSSLSVNGCTIHRLRADCTVQPFTESDDIRCCVNTIFPPEDGHVSARNLSRIVV